MHNQISLANTYPRTSESYAARLRLASTLASALVLISCFATVLGWVLPLPWLTTWGQANAPMVPNTAISLGSSALSLLALGLRSNRLSRFQRRALLLAGSLLPLITGVLTLLEYISGVDYGIDQLLVATPTPHYLFPGRPAPEAAFCQVVLGITLLAMTSRSSRKRDFSSYPALLIALIPATALGGYFFGANFLYSPFFSTTGIIGMAVNTAFCLFFLSFACLFSESQSKIAVMMTETTVGGLMARRLLIALVVIPPAIGFFAYDLRANGWIGEDLSEALAVMLCLISFVGLAWTTSKRLHAADLERIASEKGLKENEHLLKTVLDALPIGVWFTDKQGHIKYGNPEGKKIWAGARYVSTDRYGEYKGWWVDSGLPIAPAEWGMARALSQNKEFLDELIEIQCFDQTRKTISHSATPIRDLDGNVSGGIVTLVDITDRYRLERLHEFLAKAGRALIESLQSEETLKKITEIATSTIADCGMAYLVGPDESIEQSAISFGPATVDDDLKKLFIDYRPNRDSRMGLIQAYRTGHSILVPEVTREIAGDISKDDASRKLIEAHFKSYVIVPIKARERTLGVLCFLILHGPRRYDESMVNLMEEFANLAGLAIENARIHKELQAAIRARDDVVAIVSHDLLNPVNVVAGAFPLLLESVSVPPGQEDDVSEITTLLNSSIEKINHLIRDLLNLAKLESGTFVLELKKTSVKDLLTQSHLLFHRLAEDRGLSLRVSCPDDLPLLECDPERIDMVLSNLIGNAIKFTPQGGRIEIEARLAAPDQIEISVRDTGPGIPDEYLPHLFDRYWQPRSRIQRKAGAGLGLFIARGITEAHGGTIRAESQLGQGTRFTFTLPVGIFS